MNPTQPTTPNQSAPTQGSQALDPTIVNMARAIKSVETSGLSDPYTAKGKSGEYGAYQYTPDTWKADSTKYLGQEVPLEGATVAQQNEVAYKKIADLKSQGYNPAQVASIWNSGKPDPTGNVGVNKKGVSYDTPQYVKSVTSAYQQLKSGGPLNLTPTASTIAPTSQEGTQPDMSLSSQLQERNKQIQSSFQDIGAQLSGKPGSQGWWSDALQAAGGIAGGVGDIINAGMRLIPGVGAAEDWVGGEVGKAADTKVGQAVVKQIKAFQQAHPEISKDIGAGFNIVTAIPILRGLGAAGEVVGSSLSRVLENSAAKGMTDEIMGTAARTVAGRNAVANLGDDVENVVKKGIIDNRALPDVVNGKYDVTEALAKNDAMRSQIAEKELQPILDSISNQPQGRMPIDNLRQMAKAEAKRNLQSTKGIDEMFDRVQALYGDNPTLAEWNQAKKLVSEQVPQRAFDLEGYNANYNVRQTIQHGIERAGILQGLPDINAINGKMTLLYQADKLLKAMDGKPVKVGLFSKLARRGVTAGAGMLAGQFGGGVIPGMAAGYMADLADKGVLGAGGAFRRAILNRPSVGALSSVLKRGAMRIPAGAAALEARNLTKGR